jgi:hypothetical protein
MRSRYFVFSIMLVASLAVVVTRSSGQSQFPDAQSANPTAPGTAPPGQAPVVTRSVPVKVWTNDDIDTLPHTHSAAATGSQGLKNVSSISNSKPSQEKDPAWYRKQLAPLNAEIEKLDPQIARLKAFLSGDMVSDPPTMHRQMGPSPKEQLQQMEAKRDADAAKVEELLDRARHNGIEPGQLR